MLDSARMMQKFLILLLVGAVALIGSGRISLMQAFHSIQWPTLGGLFGLLVLTCALEASGYLQRFGARILARLSSERAVAYFLVFSAAGLSAVITNDIALFVVVPLSLGIAARVKRFPLGRAVIFEALAVNVGSALTPIGNPQNLFLWQSSGVGFFGFLKAMLPLEIPLLGILCLATHWAFPKRQLESYDAVEAVSENAFLFWLSLTLYPIFLVALDLRFVAAAVGAIAIIYGIFQRRILARLDWMLLAVFLLMFVDFSALSSFVVVHRLAMWLNSVPHGGYFAGALFSQFISNVPAAILLQTLHPGWRELAYGVNVGGFGLAIGSLANLIALRLSRQKGLWLEFHIWSIGMLFIAFFSGLIVLRANF